MTTEAERRRTVTTCFPDIAISSVVTRSGQFNDVLIINDDLVFRFPRTSEAAETIAEEVVVLNHLRSRVPLAVPNPLFSGVDDRGRPFLGYERLAGRPLDRQTLDALRASDPEAFLGVAGQLAAFLSALHSTSTEDLADRVRFADRQTDWLSLLGAFRGELFGYLRPDAVDAVEASFDAFFADEANTAWQPHLRHGDFGGANLLYDDDSRCVTGVIDFGSVALGDPAVDLAGITAFDTFLARAMQPHYPQLFATEIHRRADFYRSTFALQQALWALRAGDADDFNDGIAAYI